MKARALVALGLLAALALGYQVRALTRGSAFRDGRVYFYGTDGWYHMRRIDFALANGFRLADFPTPDPYLNYPEGGEGYWGPLFDLGIAAGLATFGVETRTEREHVAAIVPALLGALCCAAVFLVGRAVFGTGTGVAAAFLLAALPGHVTYSQLGHLDHHVLESLFFCLLLFLYHRLLHVEERKLPYEVASVAVTVLLFLVTPFTSIAHVATLVVFALAEIRWSEGDGRAVARSLLVSAVLLLPIGLYWGTVPADGVRAWASLPRFLLFERYSLLQPMLLLAGAIAIRLFQSFTRPLAVAGAVLGALCAWPIVSGISVLVKGDPDLAFTSETQSVLFVPGADGFFLGPALELFGLVFPLVPFAAVYLFHRFRRERGVWLLTLVLFILVLVQLRFIYTFACLMAVLLARLPVLLPRYRWLGVAGVVLSLFPCASWIDAVAQNQHYATISKETFDALEWMRTSTPDTKGYSVLAPWDIGHAVVYLAERPVVADPFNHGFEPMARYFTSSDPSEAKAILESHRVRYVIPTNLSHPYLRAMYLAYARRPPGFTLRPEVEGRGPLPLDPVYRSPDSTVVVLAVPQE